MAPPPRSSPLAVPSTAQRPMVGTNAGLNLAGRDAPGPRTAHRAGAFAHVPAMLGATRDDIGGPTGYMAKGAARMAALLATRDVPTRRYRCSHVATSVRTPDTEGAAHATDIPSLFDTAEVKYGAAFVKTGDPAGGGYPAWPRHKVEAPRMVDLDAMGGATIVPGE